MNTELISRRTLAESERADFVHALFGPNFPLRLEPTIFTMAGMLAGVWAYAEFTPGIETWIQAGSRGELTLPTLTGLGMGWWLPAFVAFLAFAGWGMGRLEQRFAGLRPRA